MERDRAADNARGIGILLVIIGHFYAGDFVNYIFSFHMPLFFFLAGYLMNTERAPGDFITRRAKGLLVPYSALFFLSWALENVRFFYLRNPLEPLALIRALLLSGGALNEVPINNFPLWYLPHAFLASLVFYGLVKLSRGRWELLAGAAAIFALAAVPFQELVTGRPPLHINVLPTALFFMTAGRLWKKYRPEAIKKAAPYTALPAILCGYAISCAVGWAHAARVVTPLYFVSALCSIFGVLSVSERFRSPLLAFIGRESIVFYGLHMFVYTRLVTRLPLPPELGFFAGLLMLAAAAWAKILIKRTLKAALSRSE